MKLGSYTYIAIILGLMLNSIDVRAQTHTPPPVNQAEQNQQIGVGGENQTEAGSSPEVKPLPSTENEPLDRSVRITEQDKISSVFQNVVVVQRRAKIKAGKILFAPSLGINFSDGPISTYAFNTDIGYAFSERWEAYLNFVPSFVINERSIVSKVNSLTLQNGQKAQLVYGKPSYQYGLSVLWLPGYGKESWGPYSLIRSDTFIKATIGTVKYDSDNGMRYGLLLGKTYFIQNYLNIRVAGGFAYAEEAIDGAKSFSFAGVLEGGLVFYF